MNNYYTLIYLIREWKDKLKNTRFVEAVSTRRNLLELFFEGQQSYRLICSTSGQHAALFLDRYQKPSRQNTSTFFEELAGIELLDIVLADRDRHITFQFDGGASLVFTLYSNHANVVLGRQGLISEAFKREKVLLNQPIPLPIPGKIEKSAVTISNVNDLVRSVDALLPKQIIRFVLRNTRFPDDADTSAGFLEEMRRQLTSRAYPHFTSAYGFSIVNPALSGVEPEKEFESVNEGAAYSFFKWVRFQDFGLKRREILIRLERAIQRTTTAISELMHGMRSIDHAGKFEKYGHLLMANQSIPITTDRIGLQDLFESGEVISIPVNPDLDAVSNAELYYEKSRGVKKAHESYKTRLIDFEEKLSLLNKTRSSLEAIEFSRDLEKWIRQHEPVLKRVGYHENEGPQAAQHYRLFYVGKYEIRVGKSAVSNDELLRITHKEDIWLHARGVPGSHVVILMNRNNAYPPKEIIEKSAEIAAFFSKAKGSSLVPVIFTKKKHVRKSRGLAPGAVFVDKEDVVLVKPREPVELN